LKHNLPNNKKDTNAAYLPPAGNYVVVPCNSIVPD